MKTPHTSDRPVSSHMLRITPASIPGLISFWNFSNGGDTFRATEGHPYLLQSRSGSLEGIQDEDAPFGGTALRLEEGQWLSILRADCPGLDLHGPEGHLTVYAWIRRERTRVPQCEFIAGQWNETHRSRQYGLFLNITVWKHSDRVFGHLSHTGGPTPGYKYCMDGSMGATPVPTSSWSGVGMSYDGVQGFSWYNGLLDAVPNLNPYPLAGGLHDGGPGGSDFTVGAVDRSGVIGNFFTGALAALAVYNRALTPAELYALHHTGHPQPFPTES